VYQLQFSKQRHTSARFDLYSFDIPNRPEDETGLFNAVGQINDLIDAEIESGIPPHRIVVGGLSQGAALAVLTGLSTERKLAGVFVLSGYIPLRGKAESVRIFIYYRRIFVLTVLSLCRYANLYSPPFLCFSPTAQVTCRSTTSLHAMPPKSLHHSYSYHSIYQNRPSRQRHYQQMI
jgi:poly(3-hydroxybutyrate) depolymerase